MTVLVTGGAGYIRSTVVRDLLERGDEVISIDNLYRGDYTHLSPYKNNPHLETVIADISSMKEVEESLETAGNVTSVIHLAAVSGLDRCREDPEKAVLTNVLGTLNVLEAARGCDAQKVIFASSAAVYGIPRRTPIREDHPLEPINLYGITKLAGERIVESYRRSYGLNTVILRFGSAHGIGLFTYWETVIPIFVKQAMEGRPLTVNGSGNQGRDYIHVLDISRAII